MNIHFSRTEIEGSRDALSDVLDRIEALGLHERERTINGKRVLLEVCGERNRLYEADFTVRRTNHGPGYEITMPYSSTASRQTLHRSGSSCARP